MKYLFVLSTSLMVLASCSSAPRVETQKPGLNFPTVEHLAYGQISGEAVRAIFGPPNEVVHLKMEYGGGDVWRYFEAENHFDRLTLGVNPKTGIVTSATWVLNDGEPLQVTKNALDHFHDSHFLVKDEGLIARHYYSDDKIFTDLEKGISMYGVHGGETIMMISFRAPSKAISKQN